jgi:predicted nucleotidyltransferase
MKSDGRREWKVIRYDLKKFVDNASKRFPLDAIYLFGSRRHKTRSLRSDIDIFLATDSNIKPSDLREFVATENKALDLFVLTNGCAISVVNESFIQYPDNDSLIQETKAVRLWSKDEGISNDKDIDWVQEYGDHVNFATSVLPNVEVPMSIDRLKRQLAGMNLPTDPIIGENEEEIAQQLLKVAEIVGSYRNQDLSAQGHARGSFVVTPASEYDFQDLFWLAVKPCIRVLAWETMEIVFDGKKKNADFSLGNSRFVIEMKFIKDNDDKREVVKTLDGLTNFYNQNANIRFLLFIVYVRRSVPIDKGLWEATYSKNTTDGRTLLQVIIVD